MSAVPGLSGAGENGTMTTLQVNDQAPRRPVLGQLPKMFRSDGSPIRVLLVDDERALTNLIRMALHYEAGRSTLPTTPQRPWTSTAPAGRMSSCSM
jgi:hypothetical protein